MNNDSSRVVPENVATSRHRAFLALLFIIGTFWHYSLSLSPSSCVVSNDSEMQAFVSGHEEGYPLYASSHSYREQYRWLHAQGD